MRCQYSVYEETEDKTLEEALVHEKIILQQIANLPSRIIIRPKISVRKDVQKILLSLLILFSVVILTGKYLLFGGWFLLFCFCGGLLYCKLFMKKIIITMIILYQKYAPEDVRGACLFEPCCSEYMRISLEKYGTARGLMRGLKRLSRCRYPNGGIDEP